MITQDHDRKDRTTMRASRDFTTGTVTGGYRGSTAVLDRDTQPRALRRDTAPTRVPGRDPHAPLPTRRKPYQNRLGSKQVVSVRGRRVTTTRQTTLLAKLGATSFVLLIAGVALAMWLSGVSTQQTLPHAAARLPGPAAVQPAGDPQPGPGERAFLRGDHPPGRGDGHGAARPARNSGRERKRRHCGGAPGGSGRATYH
ncbi:hypothetical protein QP028_13250 [Corynebacterium suedekumii]|nr:hypothetical protein QP028_13250 [Corynebacterium suedekumii]